MILCETRNQHQNSNMFSIGLLQPLAHGGFGH
jgi:hypothetical protein